MRTVSNGAAHIRFVDGTDLRVGSDSEVLLDEFVYDTSGGAGAFTANMSKGVLRLVTGKLSGPSFKVRTPTALIVVRGTDFIVAVLASGLTVVRVLLGVVEITPAAGGDASTVSAGATGTVAPGATLVTVTNDVQPTEEEIDDSAHLQGEPGQDANDASGGGGHAN